MSLSLYTVSLSRYRGKAYFSLFMRSFPTSLLPYIRRVVYILVLFWTCFLYYRATYLIPEPSTSLAELTRNYGLSSLFLLFVTLTPGLIQSYLPRFFLNALLIHSRRAWGVSAFFFALLHTLIGFFYNLGGSFSSFLYLNLSEQVSLVFGTGAMAILTVLALTSFDRIIDRLGFQLWKKLHRLIYPAVLLALFHTFLIGSHFTNPLAPFSILTQLLSMVYIVLEIGATLRKLEDTKHLRSELRNTVYQILLLLIFVGFLIYFFNQVPHHVR